MPLYLSQLLECLQHFLDIDQACPLRLPRITQVLGGCLQEAAHICEGELRSELQCQPDGPGDMRGRLTGPGAPTIAAVFIGGKNRPTC
jgi:hypothetical protein